MNVPRHLALVPDGNRRWARARGRPPTDGHYEGIGNVGRIVDAAWSAGVETVSFWWGSPANLTKRSPEEVAAIVGSLAGWLGGDGAGLVARWGARFVAVGRWRELCPSLAAPIAAMPTAAMPTAATPTAGEGRRTLALLMAYDGRDEIVDAVERLRADGAPSADLGRYLWTGSLPPVDLMIRTGGEPHLSAGFLLWSLAEAELAFVDALWPDFTSDSLQAELSRFRRRNRRFGT